MKRILTGALALSLLAGTAAMAQPYGGYRDRDRDGRNDRYENDRGYRHDGPRGRGYQDRDRDCRNDRYEDDRGYRHDGGRGRGCAYGQRRHWQRGARWQSTYGGYYVSDYGRYRLRPPPRGYRWVRTNDGDYLMVAIASGIIASVILNNGY